MHHHGYIVAEKLHLIVADDIFLADIGVSSSVCHQVAKINNACRPYADDVLGNVACRSTCHSPLLIHGNQVIGNVCGCKR